MELKSQHKDSGSWRILGSKNKDEKVSFDKGCELIIDDEGTTKSTFDLYTFYKWYHKNC